MKNYRLTIITENQNSIKKAERLATLISKKLGSESDIGVFKYDKFSDSYRIELRGEIEDDLKSIQESIIVANKISSPWTVYYEAEINEVTLIFNKSETSKFSNQNFNVVKWASLEIEFV